MTNAKDAIAVLCAIVAITLGVVLDNVVVISLGVVALGLEWFSLAGRGTEGR